MMMRVPQYSALTIQMPLHPSPLPERAREFRNVLAEN
jgi:hypothetical protein